MPENKEITQIRGFYFKKEKQTGTQEKETLWFFYELVIL